jgi:hypothetical protein
VLTALVRTSTVSLSNADFPPHKLRFHLFALATGSGLVSVLATYLNKTYAIRMETV